MHVYAVLGMQYSCVSLWSRRSGLQWDQQGEHGVGDKTKRASRQEGHEQDDAHHGRVSPHILGDATASPANTRCWRDR